MKIFLVINDSIPCTQWSHQKSLWSIWEMFHKDGSYRLAYGIFHKDLPINWQADAKGLGEDLVWSQPHRKCKGTGLLTTSTPQPSGWKRGFMCFHLNRQPCVFSIPGSPCSYLWAQGPLCLPQAYPIRGRTIPPTLICRQKPGKARNWKFQSNRDQFDWRRLGGS